MTGDFHVAMLASALTLLLLSGAPEAWATTPLPGAPPPPTKRERTQVNGVTLAWATWGKGPPLVLLHGGAGHGDQWAFQLPALAQHFTVLTVDARGHGRSTRTEQPLSYALMADDLLALLDALKLDRVALLGWSDGGIVALDLALRHPERVSQLVLFGVNFDLTGGQQGTSPALTAYFQRCKEDFARLSPTPKGYAALLAALRPMWKTQPTFTTAQLATLQPPTLVLGAPHDELIRVEHVKALAAAVPGAKLEWLDDTSHFAHFQRPDAFNRAVMNFLAPPR